MIPVNVDQDIPVQIEAKSAFYKLDPHLVACVIIQESECNRFAVRYEEDFYKNYLANKLPSALPGFWPPGVSASTEKRARAFSWGLLQIMGETAREYGFKGFYLSELCEIEAGLEFGCRYLSHCFTLAGNDQYSALLKWNGGGDPKYADKVLARVANNEWNQILGL